MGALMLELDESDDIQFVHMIRPVIVGVLKDLTPPQAYVVKVNQWFGPRWLHFSHKALGALRVTSLDLCIPPFVPARVISETYYERTGGTLNQAAASLRLHIEQSSAQNARRHLRELCPDAALFWWTGDTLRSGRGTLMAYLPGHEGHSAWYAEFKRTERWQYALTRRISSAELDRFAYAGA
ncbi:MAG: hypothetical protein QM756_35230 [Polyangiaceae bacterium]